jgi:hypothetical protein
VFLILFASVLGRAVHAILIWRLENGERIGILDTLAGSTSLTSTVTAQLQLRRITLLGVALIAVWALSSIGGQGSIRQITIDEDISVQPASFNYAVPHGNLTSYVDEDYRAFYQPTVETIFLTALFGPPSMKSSPLDTWGNVKVPSIEHYENESQADDEGWYDTQGGNYNNLFFYNWNSDVWHQLVRVRRLQHEDSNNLPSPGMLTTRRWFAVDFCVTRWCILLWVRHRNSSMVGRRYQTES